MWDLSRDGFCILPSAVSLPKTQLLIDCCARLFEDDANGVLARSSRGCVYAARNLIRALPELQTVWHCDVLTTFLRTSLGDHYGLVRVLFFDKPPDRTWALGWHKDTAIAVQDASLKSAHFSRPTIKAGVPHVVASETVLQSMLTLRIHLDEATVANGPLQVVPGSHVSLDSCGVGTDRAVTILAAAGDVLAMRPLLSHCSGSSHVGTILHRRILHLEFAASRELSDGFAWHDFVPGPRKLSASEN